MVQGTKTWAPSKAAQDTINTLRSQNIRFNIITPVGYRIELFYTYERLNGKKHVHFVAELDSYGNVTEWGPYLQDHRKRAKEIDSRNFVLNADGEKIRV